MRAPSMSATAGVQLYTLREECRRDFLGALRRVRELGYPAVEGFWGLFGARAGDVRRLLNEIGLAMPAAHVSLEDLEDRLAEAVDLWGGLGCRALVCPWVSEEVRGEPDAWQRLGERLDRIGESLRPQGLALAYHNHDFELAAGDGLEAILAASAPENLSLELDVFWLRMAGEDPAATIRRHARRVSMLHLKDGVEDPLSFKPLGEGELDLVGVLEAAREAGVDTFFVEQDECDGSPWQALAESARKLESLGLL